MRARAGDWSERIGAVVLLGFGLLLAAWLRVEVAAVERETARRERQLEHLRHWLEGDAAPATAVDVDRLHGLFPGQQLVVAAGTGGLRLQLRPSGAGGTAQ